MSSDVGSALTPAEERALVVELAGLVVGDVKPAELEVFDDTVEEYFEDTETALRTSGRDESLGFGFEGLLLAPYVLAVAGPVIRYLAGVVSEAAQAEVRPRLVALLRRLFRTVAPPSDDAPVTLSPGQIQHVRDLVVRTAGDIQLDETRTRLLADAVAGQLIATG
ncbi:hypothetical protein BJY16_006253 [Actinoplanes octamycinicus]|uniref:Uncharacterized protein n=1 Tax=Actinoplanes octamycinicus TaxID=135948 RepID=A0A7W7H2J3_9ACTN|nr:hypothetical protein [Actinoplanes octamycinicus]MBB4742794.1 hypothetical protein [Actinoplanes octamycinicus]GIE58351.1 hypothetical protein Aoc01nite_37530 [Actinoplanes octamycinicus]